MECDEHAAGNAKGFELATHLLTLFFFISNFIPVTACMIPDVNYRTYN